MMFVVYVLILLMSLFYDLCLSLKCYECTGYVPCGNGQTHLMVNCPGKCIVYKNQFDQGMIIRRCCYSNCGLDGLNMYEGRLTYICSTDLCNGADNDNYLNPQEIEEGSGEEFPVTTKLSTSSTSSTISLTTSQSSLMSCHECTEHYSQCGISQNTIIHNCRMCMIYRNIWDGNIIVRRCCYSNCGPANSVGQYEGRQTYFCSSNLCNGISSNNQLPSTKGKFLGDNSFPIN